MVSLETLTPFQDKPIEPRQFQLISPRSFSVARYICHFEWIFGLEYDAFPFSSELNIMSVSKDIRQYLERGLLIFVPTADVLERAYEMLIYNNHRPRDPDERKRFEEFGTGPWEYTILPGRWDTKTKKSESLPPLFNRSSDGAFTPFFFDDRDFDTLPRFTSTVHPLIVVLLLRMNVPDNHPSQTIQEKLIAPLKKVFRKWPQWEHNRFLPMPNTKFKREYNAGGKIVCRCIYCSKNTPSTSTASSSELEDTCTDDEEVEKEGREEEYKELSRIANERISVWRGCLEGVASNHDDVKHDDILDRYAQECTDAADKVMLRQEEERAKREALAAEMQGDFSLKKKSRLS
ncbi:hypothetical protein E1B28_012080 [Marasmius oreades]|uniref:Uncharacterized protein n=1 Tax=Marasmius oreades TaxID=181124 RepID=A0A9P7RQR1_9AGAR|nr:uncharacterized protein E1B28_012080 [Marasmius oreades]KAG7088046.1 hypothetical protein E1B28_012080 [Marasmius oreades]